MIRISHSQLKWYTTIQPSVKTVWVYHVIYKEIESKKKLKNLVILGTGNDKRCLL